MRKLLTALVAAAVLTSGIALAEVTIRFGSFDYRERPTNFVSPKVPIKTLCVDRLDDVLYKPDFFGLVYYPGEQVLVKIEGDCDRVECVNVFDGSTLTVMKPAGTFQPQYRRMPAAEDLAAGKIPEGASADYVIYIPALDEQKPYLQIYRVKAYKGNRQVGALGFTVAIPWSGINYTERPDNIGSVHEIMQWGGPNQPFDNISTKEDGPWHLYDYQDRLRQYKDAECGGNIEMYTPRTAEGNMDGRRGLEYDEMNPELEWQYWWNYSARNAGRWSGEWQWGPYYQMAIDNVARGRSDGICYGGLRAYNCVLPNGLLFWQQALYQGFTNMFVEWMKRSSINYKNDPADWTRYTLCTLMGSDGWHEMQAWAQPASLPNYYAFCKANNLPTDWANAKTVADAVREVSPSGAGTPERPRSTWRWYPPKGADDMVGPYSIYTMTRCVDTASRIVLGVPKFWGWGVGTTADGYEPWFHGGMLPENFRLNESVFHSDLFGPTALRADYGHNLAGPNGDWWRNQVFYRAKSIHYILPCALFPTCEFMGGYHVSMADARWYFEDKGAPQQKDYIKDGYSFRRFRLWEYVPNKFDKNMNIIPVRSRADEHSDKYQSLKWMSKNLLWTRQYYVGVNAMEIFGREKPLTGVIVFDSKNSTDEKTGTYFLRTDLKSFFSAMFDALGTTTYIGADRADQVPSDLVKIYAPMMVDGKAVLQADVLGKKVVVPWTNPNIAENGPAVLADFTEAIKLAYPGEWPISATNGLKAAAWYSEGKTFVFVDNPPAPGTKEVPRRSSFTVRIDGLSDQANVPVVVDLMGNVPDPHPLPSEQIHVAGDMMTVDLGVFPAADCRLLVINYAPPVERKKNNADQPWWQPDEQ